MAPVPARATTGVTGTVTPTVVDSALPTPGGSSAALQEACAWRCSPPVVDRVGGWRRCIRSWGQPPGTAMYLSVPLRYVAGRLQYRAESRVSSGVNRVNPPFIP